MTGVLLSIKPKYVKEILSGAKQYEFRKRIFKSETVKTVYIYSTSPEKKIVARFQLGEIIKNHPDFLWEQYCDVSGLSEHEFFEYFSDRDTGYAIRIEELEEFAQPMDPRSVIERFVAPQSFRYVNNPII